MQRSLRSCARRAFRLSIIIAVAALSLSRALADDTPSTLSAASNNPLQNNANSTQTTTITPSNVNFTTPMSRPLYLTSIASGAFGVVAGSGVTSVLGAMIAIQTFGDASNTVFGTGFMAENFTYLAPDAATASYSDFSSVGGFNPPGNYAMPIKLTVTLPAHTQLTSRSNSITASAQAIPDTATSDQLLAIAALSLLGLRFARNRLST